MEPRAAKRNIISAKLILYIEKGVLNLSLKNIAQMGFIIEFLYFLYFLYPS